MDGLQTLQLGQGPLLRNLRFEVIAALEAMINT